MRISDLLFGVQFINRSSSIAILMTMEYRMIAMSFLKKKPPMVAIAVRLIPSSCIVNNRLQIYLRKRDIIVNFFFISITNFNFLKRNAKIQNWCADWWKVKRVEFIPDWLLFWMLNCMTTTSLHQQLSDSKCRFSHPTISLALKKLVSWWRHFQILCYALIFVLL